MKRIVLIVALILMIAQPVLAAVPMPPIAGIGLNKSQATVREGDIVVLAATVSPEARRDEPVVWSSSDETVALVDDGIVTAVSPGVAEIRAVAGTVGNRREAACRVKVVPMPEYMAKALQKSVRARYIRLNYTLKALSFGKTLKLTATVLPAGCLESDRQVTWSSSNTAVATVDSTGLVTATDVGGVVVIKAVTGNGKVAKCKLVIKKVPVKTVTVSKTVLALEKGESETLAATVSPEGATDSAVTWSVADPSVATVDKNGKVTAVKNGATTVVATAGGISGKCSVRVGTAGTVKVSVIAGGDVTMGGDPRRGGTASEKYYASLYSKFGGDMLGNISGELKAADLALINLECSFTTNSVSSSKTYIFRAKPAYARALTIAGVDVVNHSNNHMLDFGSVGLANTKSAVRSNGMYYVGNSVVAKTEVNGVSVGFCGFNPTGGSVASLAGAVIKKLDKSCDIVVASFHWGTDFKYAASSEMRSLGRAAVKAGADLVIGHHPHVVSGVEKFRGKYIVYSLGTLSSAILTPNDMDTMLFCQTFEVDPDSGVLSDAEAKLIPLSMSSDAVNDAHPVKLTGSDRKRVLDKVKKYSAPFTQTLPDSCFE